MGAPLYNFDSSGKLGRYSREQLHASDAAAAIIAFTNGVMDDGRDYYAYVAVKPSKYREFHERSSLRQSIMLRDYGSLIVSGFSSSPPPDVTRFMAEKYGFDDKYEQALKTEISRQRKDYGVKQEEKRLMDIVATIKAQKR